jgi:glycosyltransferase involved in cell wall biosynthesis
MGLNIVNSNCPEFGYELLSSVPYAYNLHLKGELGETISAFDTSCLYFFSPKHTETNCQRSWDNMGKLWKDNFPNIKIHRPQLDWDLFTPPPFKEFYKDKSIKFEKEVIVIFNRYNKEWNGPPINYLDLKTLDILFNMLSDVYQVIYINLTKGDKYFDGAKPMELNDDKILKKYPKVYSIYDVMNMYPNFSINELQLRIFANCTKYISSNGGQLILSAYFGGENIVFSKKCRELSPEVNSFYKWYHKLGGGVFQHVNNYSDLIQLVKEKWVEKRPLINILIRTSGRPNYFNKCMESIYNQKYKNWNILVGVDDPNTLNYTQKHKCIEILYDYSKVLIPDPPNNIDYGIPFKFNLYLNDLQNKVNDGFIIYLDDDDSLYDSDSLLKLTDVIKTNDDFIMWRVKFPNRLVPSDNNFGNPPVLKDISGIGYSFHVKNKEMWEPYKRGDYRIAKKLYNKLSNTVFCDVIITKLQRETEDGMGKKDDLPIITKTTNVSIVVNNNSNFTHSKPLTIIIPTFSNVSFLPECFESILKSVKDLDCEILVGIDGCNETLNYLKNKQFDKRFKFYFFEKNIGPYVIKNTLVTKSSSNNILFFDSDDIMLEDMVPEVLHVLSKNKFYKPMYIDFKNKNDVKVTSLTKSNKYGEGVFAIDRETFLSFNGFEGWRCAADSDLMGRLYSKNISFSFGKMVSFLRRIHPDSLTVKPETNYSSKMRAHYYGLSKKKRPNGVCDILSTSECKPITITYIKDPIQEKFESRKKEVDIVLGSILNLKNKKPETSVDYGKINEIISKKGVYNVNSSIKPVRQNTPKDRNELMNLKKGNVTEQMNKMFPGKPNRRGDSPNIFSNTKKNR